MGFFDWLKGKGKANGGTKAPVSDAELITVFDERGRELSIDRATFAAKILAPNLTKAWSDADQLYGLILQALNDGFPAEVVSAGKRLVTIDGASERALITHAIVLLKTGDLKGAERELETCRSKHGTTGIVLTNLAKVYAEGGDEKRSLSTLRQALEVDPNLDNALPWWAALARERGGEVAYTEALEEIAALPGAWRPQLWLARAALERGERAEALGLYEQVLSRAASKPAVLMTVSGDLGNAGALEELVGLTLPHYDPERDGFEPGMNLAQALKQLGRNDEALDMVRRLQKLDIPWIAGMLGGLEEEIVGQQFPKENAGIPELSALRFEGPLWMRGLFEPSWLFPERAEDAPELTFVGFANETTNVDGTQVQKTDDAGRLTRALPLYLAESFGIAYAARAVCLLLVAKPGGPVVFGKMPDIDMFAPGIPPSPGPQIVVLGAIVPSGTRIEVWDLKKHELIGKREVLCKLDDWAGLLKGVHSELRGLLEPSKLITLAEPPTYYRVPPDDTLLHGYALALEQLLYQVLTANQVLPKDAMWNERGFFETQFGLVERWPAVPENARMIALTGVVAAATYGSTQFEPYRKLALQWLAQAAPGSVIDRVAPAVLKRLGEDTKLASWLRQHKSGDAGYAAWLERVLSPLN